MMCCKNRRRKHREPFRKNNRQIVFTDFDDDQVTSLAGEQYAQKVGNICTKICNKLYLRMEKGRDNRKILVRKGSNKTI